MGGDSHRSPLLKRTIVMTASSISFGLLVVLLAILLLYKIRKLKPSAIGYGSQRMCPYCGLITSRSKAHCLECGRSLIAVSVTPK
jgi:hypothetical protein